MNMTLAARYGLLGVLLLRLSAFGQNAVSFEQKHESQKSDDFLFEVQPREIAAGETAVLRWAIKGATKITIEEAPESSVGRGELRKLGTFEGSSGTLQVRPTENTTYVVSCEGSTGYSCASLSVRVRVKQR